MKKLFIWGAGNIGKRITAHFDEDWKIIFVDSNKDLVGTKVQGKDVISVEEYLEQYSKCTIIIGHLYEENAVQILEKNNIENYFLCYDLPAEFKEPYIRNNLKDYILNNLASRGDYVLYGLNIYSVIVSDWIMNKYGITPSILLQDGLSEEYIQNLKNNYPFINLITKKQLEDIEVNEIFVCTADYIDLLNDVRFKDWRLTDLFDCSDKIECYYNSEIEKFHNIHKGERCFIFANGPSLKIQDLETLYENKEHCFGMNYIYYIFDKTMWRPSFYVVDDANSLNDDNGEIDKMLELNAFVGDTSKSFWKKEHRNEIYKYHKCYEFTAGVPKFTQDFSRKTYTGLTVTYTCMQLAAYMGFSEIYLLGVDFSYAKDGGVYKHFYGEESLASRGFHKYVENAYRSARKYAENNDIKIYNATRGGCLEIFERVDFDNLFKNKKKED